MKERKQETRTTEAITISRAEYDALKSQNEWLMEQLRLLKKLFGPSIGQATEQPDGQLSNDKSVYHTKEFLAYYLTDRGSLC